MLGKACFSGRALERVKLSRFVSASFRAPRRRLWQANETQRPRPNEPNRTSVPVSCARPLPCCVTHHRSVLRAVASLNPRSSEVAARCDQYLVFECQFRNKIATRIQQAVLKSQGLDWFGQCIVMSAQLGHESMSRLQQVLRDLESTGLLQRLSIHDCCLTRRGSPRGEAWWPRQAGAPRHARPHRPSMRPGPCSSPPHITTTTISGELDTNSAGSDSVSLKQLFFDFFLANTRPWLLAAVIAHSKDAYDWAGALVERVRAGR